MMSNGLWCRGARCSDDGLQRVPRHNGHRHAQPCPFARTEIRAEPPPRRSIRGTRNAIHTPILRCKSSRIEPLVQLDIAAEEVVIDGGVGGVRFDGLLDGHHGAGVFGVGVFAVSSTGLRCQFYFCRSSVSALFLAKCRSSASVLFLAKCRSSVSVLFLAVLRRQFYFWRSGSSVSGLRCQFHFCRSSVSVLFLAKNHWWQFS